MSQLERALAASVAAVDAEHLVSITAHEEQRDHRLAELVPEVLLPTLDT